MGRGGRGPLGGWVGVVGVQGWVGRGCRGGGSPGVGWGRGGGSRE